MQNRDDVIEFNPTWSLQEYERLIIIKALSYNDLNKTKTAKALGISLKSLFDRIHTHGLAKKYVNPEIKEKFQPKSQPLAPGLTD